MTPNTLLTASLSLAAILALTGCTSSGSQATENPAGSGKIVGLTETPANNVILPEGTRLAVRTTTVLSTNTQQAGQTFTASLEQPLLQAGREIAAKGAQVEGKIVDADKGGRVKGVASLSVRLTGLQAGGRLVEISTNTVTRNARTTKRRDATEIGVGAGVGAAIGALAGGRPGSGHRCGCWRRSRYWIGARHARRARRDSQRSPAELRAPGSRHGYRG